MKRDPFYQQLLVGLSGPLDGDDFEVAAATALRAVYPTLVPIRGGSDSGMDAAIADGDGRAFPVVITSSADALDNLTRNLNQYVTDGGPRRHVVFATSQRLTQKRRANLEKRAEELGFQLVQVHDQAAFADLFYHRPEICKSLLGLEPSAPGLAEVPITRRPALGIPLIGREADTTWLRSQKGDTLVCGQPGSGKTALLRQLVADGWGLFAVSSDAARVIADIQRLQPLRVVVDDAHNERALVRALRSYRESSGALFRIVASTWPGETESVSDLVGLTSNAVRQLGLLTRNETAEVVKAAGVQNPAEVLQEIVDLSEGKPGLAITLADLWLYGGADGLGIAEALARDVRLWFKPIVGEGAMLLLAGLSLGGDEGLALDRTAAAIGMPTVDAAVASTKLAAGGVLHETHSGNLAVRPPRLRQALVRDELFQVGRHSLLTALLVSAPPDSAALAIFGARAMGALVPFERLTGLLDRASSETWVAFASLGPDEARYALRARPEYLIQLARNGLKSSPHEFLEPLLDAAIGDPRALHSATDHPLRLIEDWVQDPRGVHSSAEKRVALARVATRWYRRTGDAHVLGTAMGVALDPSLEWTEHVPGSGDSIRLLRSIVGLEALRRMSELWDPWIDLLPDLESSATSAYTKALTDWAYPGRHSNNTSQEMDEFMMTTARRAGLRLVEAAGGRVGVLSLLQQTFDGSPLRIEVPLPDDFVALFPTERLTDVDLYHKWEAETSEHARSVARHWSTGSPEEFATRLATWDREALAAGRNYPRLTPLVAEVIADLVSEPLAWFRVLVRESASADLVGPFLVSALDQDHGSAGAAFVEARDDPLLHGATVRAFFRSEQLDDVLAATAVPLLDGFLQWVEVECLRGTRPERRLRQIWKLGSDEVRTAAAVGEWSRGRRAGGPPLGSDWRNAIVNSKSRGPFEYWLGEILKGDATLAHDWLRRQIEAGPIMCLSLEHEHPLAEAIGSLDETGRRCILGRLEYHWGIEPVVAGLVSGKAELYRELLRNVRLAELHLAPLRQPVDARWMELALVALDEGISPRAVVDEVWSGSVTFSGEESGLWAAREASFLPWTNHPNREVARIAAMAVEVATHRRIECERQEHEEDVMGR